VQHKTETSVSCLLLNTGYTQTLRNLLRKS